MKSKGSLKNRMLVKGLRCLQCNAILPASTKFCGICGEKLDKSVKVWPIVSLLSDVAVVLLPLFAIALWSFSLSSIHIQNMTDLGLVSVLPATTIIALLILMISFYIALNQQKPRALVLLLHVLLLIFMLYSITTFVEEAPRFAIVYRHAGYADFIMRTGAVDPSLDAYFSWPGFFIFSAFLTRVAGYNSILSYADWAPLYLNLIYLGPLYVIFCTATANKRIVWLGIFFFYVTDWIWQDYFSPQGLDFFMYLVIIAILLKWFKRSASTPPHSHARRWHGLDRLFSLITRLPLVSRLYEWLIAPDTRLAPVHPRQRAILFACVVVIFAFMVFSHPLTPFMAIASVAALAIFGRITPRWLPILMSVMTAAWIIFMAQAYLVGHIANVLGGVGQFNSAISDNVTSRLQGSPEHTFITRLRLFMTLFVWGLAFVGGFRRLRRGYRDATFVLLAVAPFPILLVQSYGGEMLMRIYLFTLPPMVFFAAALFYSTSARSTSVWKRAGYGLSFLAQEERSAFARSPSKWMKVAVGVICIVLLGSFLFTRYGNERDDYITNAELAGVRHLYSIAPPGSLLMSAWDGTPWEFQNYEKYFHEVLGDDVPDAIVNKDVGAIVRFIENVTATKAYLILTRSQKATAEASGLPPDILNQLEHALLRSGKFVPVYSNSDAQILLYTGGTVRGSP